MLSLPIRNTVTHSREDRVVFMKTWRHTELMGALARVARYKEESCESIQELQSALLRQTTFFIPSKRYFAE